MHQTPATPDEVRDLLGDVDDLIVERILESSASADEIAEALRSLEAEDLADKDVDFAPSSPRVTEVRTIMTELAVTDEDDLFGMPLDDEDEEDDVHTVR
jgi:hypothetical protein